MDQPVHDRTRGRLGNQEKEPLRNPGLDTTLKNEMYHQQVFHTRARARFAVAEYIEVFYNRRRPHSSLGYRTPARAWADAQADAAEDLPWTA